MFHFIECVLYHTAVFIPVLLSVFTTSKSLFHVLLFIRVCVCVKHPSFLFIYLFFNVLIVILRALWHGVRSKQQKNSQMKHWNTFIFIKLITQGLCSA